MMIYIHISHTLTHHIGGYICSFELRPRQEEMRKQFSDSVTGTSLFSRAGNHGEFMGKSSPKMAELLR